MVFAGRWCDVAERLEELNSLGQGVCVQLNRARDRIKTDVRGAAAFTALHLDYDKSDTSFPITHPFPPTLIVWTGRGFHLYWAIEPVRGKKAQEHWHRVSRALIVAYDGDPGCGKVSQVARLAGTYNYKNFDHPKLVEVVQYHPDRVYLLEDFDELLPLLDKEDIAERLPFDEQLLAIASQRRIGFPLCRAVLKEALAALHLAQKGHRRTTLVAQAYRLGCFKAYARPNWTSLCTKNCSAIFRGWVDNDLGDMQKAFRDSFLKGAIDGLAKPPFATDDERCWRQQAFLETLNASLLGPFVYLQLIGTPEQRALFDNERHASYNIGKQLKLLGYRCVGNRRVGGRQMKAYELRSEVSSSSLTLVDQDPPKPWSDAG